MPLMFNVCHNHSLQLQRAMDLGLSKLFAFLTTFQITANKRCNTEKVSKCIERLITKTTKFLAATTTIRIRSKWEGQRKGALTSPPYTESQTTFDAESSKRVVIMNTPYLREDAQWKNG